MSCSTAASGWSRSSGRTTSAFPATWEAGLCRDVNGQPIQVPWLTDHRHQGVPYWWCCTRQPLFRQFLEERVTGTVRKGAHGVHVDDHLGTSGALFLGACFCDRCVEGFRARDPDYRSTVRAWLGDAPAGDTRRVQDHPLWREWSVYHLRGAAAFMAELRALAAREAGREVPMSANAGLLWPNHLADYRALDFFSAEIEHAAADLRFTDRPLFAYRLADAMGRPLAATASGQDWAFVKEHGRSGLVRGWIAASYAAGHSLMAPHRQWCHTEEKGTHWYEGPRGAYAPLYRFVRENRALLDDHEPWAEVGLVMPHRSFADDRERWIGMGEALSAAGVPYRIVVGGDDVVDRAIEVRRPAGSPGAPGPFPRGPAAGRWRRAGRRVPSGPPREDGRRGDRGRARGRGRRGGCSGAPPAARRTGGRGRPRPGTKLRVEAGRRGHAPRRVPAHRPRGPGCRRVPSGPRRRAGLGHGGNPGGSRTGACPVGWPVVVAVLETRR